MSRVASIVLLVVGTFLCVTWLVSPASSEPQVLPSPAGDRPGASLPPEAVTVEPIRLEALEPPPSHRAVPRRNPFSFESRPTPTVRHPESSAQFVPARPAPRLPQLVAIIKDSTTDGDRYRAVLSADRMDVTIVQSGAMFGSFSIADVRPDVVILRDAVTGDLFRLALQ